MTIQTGDFIRVSYTGKNDDRVFDTTNEEIARANDIYNEKGKYGGDVIIVGAGHTVAGLDEDFVGKEAGYSGSVACRRPAHRPAHRRSRQAAALRCQGQGKRQERPAGIVVRNLGANGRSGIVTAGPGGQRRQAALLQDLALFPVRHSVSPLARHQSEPH